MILDLLATALAKLPWFGPRFERWYRDESWDDETRGDAENPSIP